MKTQKKQGLIWGGLLILFGLVALMEIFADLSTWVWVAVLVAGGIGIYAAYSIERTEKWLLVISYVLLVVGSLISFITINVLQDLFIPSYVLVAIALPFLVAFLQSDRTKWGLVIPAYILLVISVMIPLLDSGILDGVFVAAYVFIAIAIPFFLVYARDSKRWWALIPGGITTATGLSFLFSGKAAQYIVPAILIIAGIWLVVHVFTQKEA